MQSASARCIYCSAGVDPFRGEGDHVIPEAFGRFHDELRFRRICRDCNARIGVAERQLLHCAPEAYLRRVVDPPRSRAKRGKSWVAAAGGKRPVFTVARQDGLVEEVDISANDPRTSVAHEKLLLRNPERGEAWLRLHPAMTAEKLLLHISRKGYEPQDIHAYFWDEQNEERYQELIRKVTGGSQFERAFVTEAGMHEVEGRIRFEFTTGYYQAIAKIALHYLLSTNVRGTTGEEPAFNAIREFIIDGGDHQRFFDRSGARFELPFGERPGGGCVSPSTWIHFLGVDDSDCNVTAAVYLFQGPGVVRPGHYVRLAQFSSRLLVPCAVTSHVYQYAGTEAGYAGNVHQMQPFRR